MRLRQKLASLESKVIVGGENLLDRVEQQAYLLEEARKELEKRKAKEHLLRQRIQEKEAERIDMEERYSSLQEEVQGKTRKLRKVWTLLHTSKSEIEDMRQEHQRQMEQLLEGVRQLTKELKLSSFLVDEYIPAQYQVWFCNISKAKSCSCVVLNLFHTSLSSKSLSSTSTGARSMANGSSEVWLTPATISTNTARLAVQLARLT